MVLYVYPKDNTSGCTTEAKEFNDAIDAFKEKGYGVAGISKDSVKSHQGFAEKYGLRFPLLSDPELTLLTAIDVYGDKIMYGRTVKGIIRSTFVLDSSSSTIKIYPKVKAAGHAAQVLKEL